METSKNRAALTGRASGQPRLSHVNHGVEFFLFPLEVERLSGAVDTLNVIAPRSLLEHCPVRPGGQYSLSGEVRSFNNRSGVGSRLVITFFARELSPDNGEHANNLELTGVLCRPPVLRRTPLGREICDLLLAVNRRYDRSDYLPCIAWGATARACARLAVGDGIHMTGRLQSRKYCKLEQGREVEHTAYEISVLSLEAEERMQARRNPSP